MLDVPASSPTCSLESPYPVGDAHSVADLDLEPSSAQPRFDPPQVKLEIRGVTSQAQHLLWSKYTVWKNTIAAKLREGGKTELAKTLEDCHTHYTFAVCRDCSTVQKFPNRCDRLICPECAPRLQRERQKAVEWWAREVKQPKFVTLTVRTPSCFMPDHIREFKRWFGNLRRTRFASNWVGGFYSLEVTNEGRGWHLHLHALIDARWIDAGELGKTWCKVTNGHGYIVKVKDARCRDYLHETTKYIAKGNQIASWSSADVCHFVECFEGVRTFGVFGSLYGLRTKFAEWFAVVKSLKPKCTCGSCDVSYYDEAAFLAFDLVPNVEAASIPPPTPECLTPWLNLEFAAALPPR